MTLGFNEAVGFELADFFRVVDFITFEDFFRQVEGFVLSHEVPEGVVAAREVHDSLNRVDRGGVSGGLVKEILGRRDDSFRVRRGDVRDLANQFFRVGFHVIETESVQTDEDEGGDNGDDDGFFDEIKDKNEEDGGDGEENEF